MKEIVKQVEPFLTFEIPLQMRNISTQFSIVHQQHLQIFPEWDALFTRQRLIASYWFKHVLRHFAAIILLSSLLLWPYTEHYGFAYLGICFLVSLICFPVLALITYLPTFSYQFLPRLEVIVAGYQKVQQEQKNRMLQEALTKSQGLSEQRLQKKMEEQGELLLERQTESMQRLGGRQNLMVAPRADVDKCRQAQLPNLTLTLIYYTQAKLTGITPIHADDQTATLLCKLYGVDKGSLRRHLEVIVGTSAKRKGLSGRRRTEIHNRIEEAMQLLGDMNCPEGIQILEELERKILVSSQSNIVG